MSTYIYLEESQNVRVTAKLVDYVANLIGDSSLARSSLTAYINYGNGVQSDTTNLNCNEECIDGAFVGNIDVRNGNLNSGTYKLVIEIYAYMADQFKVNLLSIGDLVLSSKIFEESKGRPFQSIILQVLNFNFFLRKLALAVKIFFKSQKKVLSKIHARTN